MKVEKLGKGEPEHAVLYCVHGNEPCGKLAVDRIKHEQLNIQKPVKLVFANEKAYEAGERAVDEDLNRTWHAQNGTHEAKIAEKIKEELKGLKVLDIHSSYSHRDAFGLPTYSSEEIWGQVDKLGVKTAANIEEAYEHQLKGFTRIPVECGYTGSEDAIRNAYRITKNFLKSNNIIKGKSGEIETKKFKIYDKKEGKNFQFIKNNFQKVKEGEAYAIKKGEKLRAEEEFYPVLMSTTGYDNIIGFKAEMI